MKTKINKNKSIKTLILAAMIITIFSFGLFYIFNQHQDIQKTNIPKESPEKSIDKSDNTKQNHASNKTVLNTEKDLPTNSDMIQSPIKDPNNHKYTVNISTHTDSTPENIVIRGLINLSIESGFCEILLTSPKGVSEVKKTEILMSPTTSSCKTLTLPKDTLEKGTWKYKIKYETNEIIGETDETTFKVY